LRNVPFSALGFPDLSSSSSADLPSHTPVGSRSVPPSLPAHFRPTDATLDTALRYHAALERLRDRWRPDARVLEVGSGSGGATE
jgi:hypothetical protein